MGAAFTDVQGEVRNWSLRGRTDCWNDMSKMAGGIWAQTYIQRRSAEVRWLIIHVWRVTITKEDKTVCRARWIKYMKQSSTHILNKKKKQWWEDEKSEGWSESEDVMKISIIKKQKDVMGKQVWGLDCNKSCVQGFHRGSCEGEDSERVKTGGVGGSWSQASGGKGGGSWTGRGYTWEETTSV